MRNFPHYLPAQRNLTQKADFNPACDLVLHYCSTRELSHCLLNVIGARSPTHFFENFLMVLGAALA